MATIAGNSVIRRVFVAPLLALNFVLFLSVAAIAGWAINLAIDYGWQGILYVSVSVFVFVFSTASASTPSIIDHLILLACIASNPKPRNPNSTLNPNFCDSVDHSLLTNVTLNRPPYQS
jgi:hypothetical protein